MGCTIYGREKAGFIFHSSDTNFTSAVTFSIDGTIISANIDEEVFHSFTSPGSKTVKASIDFDDGWGNIYTYETSIQVSVKEYNAPVIDFTWSPFNPTIQDTVTFTPDYVDTRNDNTNEYHGKVLEIDFDILDDGDIETTINPGEVFTYQFEEKHNDAPVRMYVRYDSGFGTKQVDILNNIQMANIPPVASWSISDNGGQCVPSYTWSNTSYDIDGTISSSVWALYIIKNDTETLVNSYTGDNFTWVFQEPGTYKLVLTVFDSDNDSTTYEDTFNVQIKPCGADNNTADNTPTFIIEWE